ncbi:hypothetical protein GGI11_001035 [Coemansia sp. RSA 2049]|nr:hypothetical protein GGI11_001035 [Coemansia sp. RSA 2049]KAJ2606826.1 hypothetical protein EV177_005828 [Coemansia sp. RSA 1804]KAJ2682224.1 hypothetical protein GGH99_004831 [Coemansia sp. RSA 1285]
MTRFSPYNKASGKRTQPARTQSTDGVPLAIISTHGPSVLSAALVPSGSRLQRMSLLAHDPFVRVSGTECTQLTESPPQGRPGSKRRSRRHRRWSSTRVTAGAQSTDLLVSSIGGGRDAADVRCALVNSPEARCLVEYHSGMGTCITTLRDDGFVWNLSALLDPRSSQYSAVSRRSPFMRRFGRSDGTPASSSSSSGGGVDGDDDGGSGDDSGGGLLQVDCITVHEIHQEDCPRII